MKESIDAILHGEQAEYLDSLLPTRDAVLQALEADADQHGVPIVDPEVGRFLQIAALSVDARRILEVGTATGYSGLHFLQVLPPDGELITIDIDDARQRAAHDYWRQAGVAAQATTLLGPALELLPTVTGTFDLVFLDAIKDEYRRYLDLALPLLRAGGLVLADNVLRAGRVARRDSGDADAASLDDFNRYAMGHPQLRSLVLPLGDGLLYAVKTAE